MGSQTSLQLQTELARRITQLATGGGSAAEAAINRGIRWANRQGSYTFQLSAPTTVNPNTSGSTTSFSTPADFDSGKAFILINSSGNQVRMSAVSGLADSANFNTIASTDFDQYYVVTSSTGSSTVYLYPSFPTPPPLTMVYHKITLDITGGSVSNLPRDFDDLIVDLAEAEEKRIYDVGDAWPQLIARCQDQIKVLLDGYKSQTIETGLESEGAALIGTKAKLGRD